jgi:hypothetical protein
MAKMTTQLLRKAAKKIAKLNPGQEVTGIEFEDGSGHKFNYNLDGGPAKFLDLGKEFLENKPDPEFDAGDHIKPNT